MPNRPQTHRMQPQRRPPDARPSASERGYDRRWRKLRLVILARDPICKRCNRKPSLHVDHVIAKERGGSDDPGNLQGLCQVCHSQKTAEVDGGLGRQPRGTGACAPPASATDRSI